MASSQESRPSKPTRPLGISILAMAHFIFALAPLVWLVVINSGLVSNTVGSCEGHQSGSCAMATAPILLPLIFNGVVTIPLGYAIWKGSKISRILAMVFAILWLLVGALFVSGGSESSLFLYGLLMVGYGLLMPYYLTRKQVKPYFR